MTTPKQPEWKEDLETEKLIVGKNQHSVLHYCIVHGTGIPKPLENRCPNCVLYLSGKDVRSLLLSQRQEIVKSLEGMKRTRENTIPSIANNPRFIETVEQQNIGWNAAISDAISIINKEQK